MVEALAKYLPGGAKRYLGALASQVESRLKLLHAIERPATSTEEAAQGLALGLESLVGVFLEATRERLPATGGFCD